MASLKGIPPIATDVTVAWYAVCMYVCRLSHSCTLLMPLDGMRCHLAGTEKGRKGEREKRAGWEKSGQGRME